jgi:hypothetical protein
MAGLSLEDGGWHFWVYYLVVTLTASNGSSLVYFMAYFAPDRDVANAMTGMCVSHLANSCDTYSSAYRQGIVGMQKTNSELVYNMLIMFIYVGLSIDSTYVHLGKKLCQGKILFFVFVRFLLHPSRGYYFAT